MPTTPAVSGAPALILLPAAEAPHHLPNPTCNHRKEMSQANTQNMHTHTATQPHTATTTKHGPELEVHRELMRVDGNGVPIHHHVGASGQANTKAANEEHLQDDKTHAETSGEGLGPCLCHPKHAPLPTQNSAPMRSPTPATTKHPHLHQRVALRSCRRSGCGPPSSGWLHISLVHSAARWLHEAGIDSARSGPRQRANPLLHALAKSASSHPRALLHGAQPARGSGGGSRGAAGGLVDSAVSWAR